MGSESKKEQKQPAIITTQEHTTSAHYCVTALDHVLQHWIMCYRIGSWYILLVVSSLGHVLHLLGDGGLASSEWSVPVKTTITIYDWYSSSSCNSILWQTQNVRQTHHHTYQLWQQVHYMSWRMAVLLHQRVGCLGNKITYQIEQVVTLQCH